MILSWLIKSVFLKDFHDALFEGHVYDIEYFQVEDAKVQFRAAHHDFQASFTAWTKVSQVEPIPEDFPLYGYKIRSFHEIMDNINDKTYLADVIAMITGISNISMVDVKGRATAKRVLRICDTRENTMLTLWDAEAKNLDVDALRILSKKEPVVALIVGCTYKKHECETLSPSSVLRHLLIFSMNETAMLSLSASYGARLYINPADANVQAFRNRYKLAFQATNESCAIEVLFFGDMGQQLIGRAVDDLVSESQDLGGSLPPAISAVLGRKYVVDVTISRGSFKRHNISFQVLKFYQEGSIEFIQLQPTDDGQSASSSTSITIATAETNE